MMGERTVMQEALFYSFSLEQYVPSGHLLRSIDRCVDLSGIREHLRPHYSETGRPSIDPELMIRMLLVGYCMGIRSERRLCEGRRIRRPSEPCLPLVLSPWPGWRGAGSLDLFQEPARALSRQRSPARVVRDDG
jgi:hypothetical protein